jgi:hypothetical protein
MSQHDLDIANQTASAARADINLALKALGSTNSGSTAPATTYANMLWADTSANILKIRAEANDAWISIGYLNQAADAFSLFDDTQLVNTSGTQVGLLGDQATATWEGGTGTLQSLVSPANVKAAALASGLGSSQTWQDVKASRTGGVSYQNTTSSPIQVSVTSFGGQYFEASSNNTTWVRVGQFSASEVTSMTPIIPTNHYYRLTTNTGVLFWAELR